MKDYTDIPDFAIFHEQRWLKLSRDERLAELKKIEEYAAGKEGRPAVPIVAAPLAQNLMGQYCFGQNRIEINEKFLTYDPNQDKNAEAVIQQNLKNGNVAKAQDLYNDIHAFRYRLLDTIVHEGRHAQQDQMVHSRNNPEATKTTVQHWKENLVAVKDGSGRLHRAYMNWDPTAEYNYRFQPIEGDAHQHAKEWLHDVVPRHSNPQELALYQWYAQKQEQQEQQLRQRATAQYGVNYEKEIAEKVRCQANYLDRHVGTLIYPQVALKAAKAVAEPSRNEAVQESQTLPEQFVSQRTIAATLQERCAAIERELKHMNEQYAASGGAPRSEAALVQEAIGLHTNGESLEMKAEWKTLRVERDTLEKDRKNIEAYGRDSGFDRSVVRHFPGWLQDEHMKYYKTETARVAEKGAELDARDAGLQQRLDALNERLKSPQDHAAVENILQQLKAREKEREQANAPLVARKGELQQECSEIQKVLGGFRERNREEAIRIVGNPDDSRNLLEQAAQIQAQTSAMEQRLTPNQKQGIAR